MAEFSDNNKIDDIETASGRFMHRNFVRRLVARDQELLDRMQKGGPPGSVGAGSPVGVNGDLVYTANATLSGIINCNTFTMHPNILVNAEGFVYIRAATEVVIHGYLVGDAGGQQGGVRGSPAGTSGESGVVSAGGGGLSDEGNGGGVGGGRYGGGGGGTASGNGVHGGDAGQLTLLDIARIVASPLSHLVGGSGGGGGGDSSGGDGAGGRGGAVIIIETPKLTVTTNAQLTANGENGHFGGTSTGGGGGGGAGFIYMMVGNAVISPSALISALGGEGGSSSGNQPWGRGGKGADGFVQVDVMG